MNDTAKSLMKMYLIVYLNHKQSILNYTYFNTKFNFCL